MAKEKTKKSCYESKFGGGWISEGQYLAEIMCQRFALSQKESLGNKFWEDKYWLKKFLLQTKHANDLLKQYKIEYILKALEQPDDKKVYSLGLHSVLIPLIKKFIKQESIIQQNSQPQPKQTVSINTLEQPRPVFNNKKKNILDKLREFDDG